MSKTILILLFVVSQSVNLLCASADEVDSVDAPVKRKVPRRSMYYELSVGILQGSALTKVNDTPTREESQSSIGLMVGLGLHIPIVNLDEVSTIWLAPSAHTGSFFSDFENFNDKYRYENEHNNNSELQLYATYSHGGLRKRNSHWGVEAGLGAVWRFEGFGSISSGYKRLVVPSLLVEAIYTPGVMLKLRLTSDVFTPEMPGGVTARQMCFSVVVGW